MAGVAGIWYGQRGARLELKVAVDGRLEGRYYTTGKDEKHTVFEVIGMSDTCSFGGCRSVGFVVCWNNEYVNQHSVTSWSGQYRVENGEELLTTNWLLTRETAAEDGWAATMIGTDTFRRVPVREIAVPICDEPVEQPPS